MAIKLADTLAPMADFPAVEAKDVAFNDNKSLQEKYDNGELGGGTNITVDSAMSDISTNPVQNKVIKEYVDNKSTNVSEIDGNAIIKKSDGLFVEDLSSELAKINFAQKTVNDIGSVSLLDTPYLFTTTPATTLGNAFNNRLEHDLILNESILNYDEIQILISMGDPNDASTYIKRVAQPCTFKVRSIQFNPSSDSADYSNAYATLVCENISPSSAAGTYGNVKFTLTCWFKDDKTLHLHTFYNPHPSTKCSSFMIDNILGIKEKTIIVDPLEYVNSTKGIEDTPVGSLLHLLKDTSVPKHYLSCDGSIYNIVDYPYLSEYIKTEFGAYDHFGGDGVTTFAVPSLGILAGEVLYSYKSTGNKNDEDTWQATADCTVTYTLATGLRYNAVLYVDGVQVDMSNPNVPNVSTSGTVTLNKGQTLKVECGDAITTIKAVSLKTASYHCIKYEPTYFIGQINSNEYIEEILDKQSFNMSTPGVNQIGITKQFTKSITDFDKIEFAYSLSKTVETTKDYVGTYDGVPTDITYTNDNKGFVFNGTSSQIHLQDNAKTFPLTVEIVLSATSYKHNALIYTDAPTGIAIGNWASSKNTFVCSASTSNRYVVPSDFYNGTIRTLTVVYTTASNIEVYADGVLLTTTDGTNTWGLSGSGDSYIGKRATGSYFNGNIYGVRVYSRALSSSEVLQSHTDNIDYVVNNKPKVSRTNVIQEYDFRLDIENNKPSFHTTRTIRVDDIDYTTSMMLDITKPSTSNGIDSSAIFYNIKDKDNIEFEQTINRNSYSTSATTRFTQIHIDKVRGIKTINKIQSI